MKRLRDNVRGLLLVGGLAVGLAPASLLTDTLSELCADECRFAEVDGYWWRGSAAVYLKTGRRDQAWSALGQWRWQPEGLGLRLTAGAGSARLSADWPGLRLAVDDFRLPAGSLLSHFGHGLPRDGWDGELTARATQLLIPWDFGTPNGQGEIIWRQARTSLLENYPLGDFRLAWTLPADGHGRGRLQSEAQPVTAAGELSLEPFRFTGQVRLAPAAGALKKYLDLIARPDGENRYRIALPRPAGG